MYLSFFFFKQKTAYEMRISDWSSDVCSSDLAGYAVDSAFDGEEGYFLGETEPYDLVILDTGLPKMDGISVLEQWRRAERKMPVIILTARDRWKIGRAPCRERVCQYV